jgi:hypothetical protein
MPLTDTSVNIGTGHKFGLYDPSNTGAVAIMTITSDPLSKEFGLTVEVTDQYGRVVTKRYDDTRNKITLEGTILSAGVPPAIGTTFTYNSIKYIIEKVDDRGVNNDFRKLSLDLVKYQEIALA